MFHNDVQTSLTNNWKRHNNEHPLNQVFIAYFNTNNSIKNLQSNTRSNGYKSETKHIIQRQRVIRSFLNKPDETESSIRKFITLDTQPKVLSITSIPPPQSVFSELNERSTNNNNRQQTIKKEFDQPSPLLIRRHRPTIENLSFKQQVSDITNVSGNQLLLTIPPNFTFRNKPSRKINRRISSPRIKPSKTINEVKQNLFHPKSIHPNHSLPTPIWTPTLADQDTTHTRTLADIFRSKAHATRIFKSRHSQQIPTHKINTNFKSNDIQDLYISPRSLNNLSHDLEINKNIRHQQELIVDEWEDSKFSNGVSDEDESISVDGNGSISTCKSPPNIQQDYHQSSSFLLPNQYDTSLSPMSSIDNPKSNSQRSSTKRNISRRRGYNLALPPVAEHIDDEETDMKEILEKISSLQNNDFNERKFEQSFNDEDSLTFQLLNQQETEFEKKLSKLRKFQFK